jgi:hypothetical protein
MLNKPERDLFGSMVDGTTTTLRQEETAWRIRGVEGQGEGLLVRDWREESISRWKTFKRIVFEELLVIFLFLNCVEWVKECSGNDFVAEDGIIFIHREVDTIIETTVLRERWGGWGEGRERLDGVSVNEKKSEWVPTWI